MVSRLRTQSSLSVWCVACRLCVDYKKKVEAPGSSAPSVAALVGQVEARCLCHRGARSACETKMGRVRPARMATFTERLCLSQMTGFLSLRTFLKERHGRLPARFVLFLTGWCPLLLSRFGMAVTLHLAAGYPSRFTVK